MAPRPARLIQRRKGSSSFLICAVAIGVGTPGFNRFDSTGLTHEFGLFNLTSLWHIGVFATVTLWAMLSSVMSRDKYWLSAKGLRLAWCFYAWMAFVSILAAMSAFDLLLAVYRLAEWCIVLFIVQRLFSGSPHEAFATFAHFVRITAVSALAVLALVWFYDPALPYSYSPEIQTVQLGGVAIHPNGLSVVLGLGALYWALTGQTRFRSVIVGGLVAACFLTWSRSGISACVAGLLVYMIARSILHRRASIGTALLATLALAGILLLAILNFDYLFALILRGQDITLFEDASGRSDVWAAAFDLFKQSPLVGHGFIFGPRLLEQSPYLPPYWAAPHAHNDLLNAAVAGGIVAGAILLTIYCSAALASLRLLRVEPLFIATFIVLLIANMFECDLSTQVGVTGMFLLGLLRVVALPQPLPRICRQRAPASAIWPGHIVRHPAIHVDTHAHPRRP